MIDLEHGRIQPENLPLSLFPELTKGIFLDGLPGDQLRFSHDPGQGYAFFFLEPVTLEGQTFSCSVTFDSEDALYEVRISLLGENATTGSFASLKQVESQTIPEEIRQGATLVKEMRDRQVDYGVETASPIQPWKPAEETKVKAANDSFLLERCGFSKKNRNRAGNLEKTFAWGKVVSYFDDQGCSSDIILRYARKDQPEDGFEQRNGRGQA